MRRLIALDSARAVDLATSPTNPAAQPTLLLQGRAIATLDDRCVRYMFSDASVGRDMHTIAADAWDTRNFETNPVFLWAHQDDELPIGRVENLANERGQLVGQVRYPDRGVHPFADTVYELVKGGYLNATSTGWLPLEYKAANDRKRPGGLDFTRVELLEISQVPVPALPTALATARSAGIDLRPLFTWAERLLDCGDFAVIGKRELEQLRKETRMPRKPAKELPRSEPLVVELTAARKITLSKRGLWSVGWLAQLVDQLASLQTDAKWEAEIEQDGSAVPADLLAALKTLGAVLVAMTEEEVAELFAGDDIDVAEDDDGDRTSPRGFLRRVSRLEPRQLSGLEAALNDIAAGRSVVIHTSEGAKPVTRIGAKYSAETVRCLRAAHEHARAAHEQLSDMLEDADDSDPESDDPDEDSQDDDNERSLRERKARAALLRFRHSA